MSASPAREEWEKSARATQGILFIPELSRMQGWGEGEGGGETRAEAMPQLHAQQRALFKGLTPAR